MPRILAGLILIISIFLGGYYFPAALEFARETFPSREVKMLNVSLSEQKDLGKYSQNIESMQVNSHLESVDPQISQKITTALARVFPTRKNGKYIFEIEMMDATEAAPSTASKNTEIQIVLQISVLDSKTKNKVAEFGSTLNF